MAVIREAEFRSDLERYMKTRVRAYAKAAADAGQTLAASALMSFYASYSPTMYQRTGNLLNSFKRYYRDNGTRVYGGVRITTEGMSDYMTGTWSTSQVASATWLGGQHGNYVTTPPYTILVANFIALSPTFDAMAIQAAHAQGYAVLKF